MSGSSPRSRPSSTRARSRRRPTARCSSPRTRWTRSVLTRPSTAASSDSSTARTRSSSPKASAPSKAWPGTTGAPFTSATCRSSPLSATTTATARGSDKTVLFKDLGQTDNQGLNDHIVSGIQFGMDGWLYISVGDKGIPLAPARRQDGDDQKGAGSSAAGPTARGLRSFSYGTRNHLEANLDDRDTIFTYDNTDDGARLVDPRHASYRQRLLRLSVRLPRLPVPHAPPHGRVRRRFALRRDLLQGGRLAREIPRRRLLGRVGQGQGPRLQVRSRRRRPTRSPRRSTSPSPASPPTSARSTWPSRTTARRCTSPTGTWAAGAPRPKRSAASGPSPGRGESNPAPRGKDTDPIEDQIKSTRPPRPRRTDAGAGCVDREGAGSDPAGHARASQ